MKTDGNACNRSAAVKISLQNLYYFNFTTFCFHFHTTFYLNIATIALRGITFTGVKRKQWDDFFVRLKNIRRFIK